MDRSDGGEKEIWGTWEDLLLASAVNRHGSDHWDAVAGEVGSRSRSPHRFSPLSCERRYHLLRRRFQDAIDSGEGGEGPVPWLGELRRLRVDELRREVERSDVSIVSLQLKVKNLTEDREGSRSVAAGEKTAADGKVDVITEDDVKREKDDLPGRGDLDGGPSCNESNSPKEESKPEKPEEKPDPVAGGEEKPAEGSCNGSSDSIAKVRNAEEENRPKVRQPESGESIAVSKDETGKESSDVQSSASLTRRRGVRRRAISASGGSSGGDSPERDEVSPPSKEKAEKSQPLAAFLEIIRSNKYGSVFERRLEIQESTRYRNLIRQHIDVKMVRTKLEGGLYTSTEFFRDLLLLCNNAIVFFPAKSAESTAAIHLRKIINKEIATHHWKRPFESSIALPPLPPLASKPKLELDDDDKPLRPANTAPLLQCRKRSSTNAKVGGLVKEKSEEKPDLEKELEEEEKKKRDRPLPRGLRTTKARGATTKRNNVTPINNVTLENKLDSIDNSVEAEKLVEKKTNSGSNAVDQSAPNSSKKKGAAVFLDRLKKGSMSSSSNGDKLLRSLKSSGSGGTEGPSDQKKGGKGDGRKESNGPVKRSVGRPPKRPQLTPPLHQPAKRARTVEKEVSPLPPTRAAAARKRARR